MTTTTPLLARLALAPLLAAVLLGPGGARAAGYAELAAAIRAGDEAQVTQLLQAGVDASSTGGTAGAAPLLIAASRGQHAIARRLLAAGAATDPRYAAYYDATPLMLAVNNRDRDMVRLLLDAGAQVNLVDRNGDPALNWATFYGDLVLADLLLERGADPTLSGHGNALEVAMRRGHQVLVERYLDHLKRRHPLSPAEADAVAAIDRDDAAALQAALARGVAPGFADATGRPALARAARGGRLATLRVLLAAGAPVDATDPLGFTALFEAARDNQPEAARLLLDAGADPNRVARHNGLGMTPMHAAASTAQAAMIRLLAARGAALDTRDDEGATALGWAINAATPQAALALAELGADPDIAPRDGQSPRQIARDRGLAELLAAMRR